MGANGQDGIYHLYVISTTKICPQYFTDCFLYHIIINLTRVTSEANVSMASREAKKARRQKLEVLARTKLSLTEKVSLLCPLKFIDLYAYKVKGE